MNNIVSPITLSSNVLLEKTVSTEDIIMLYKRWGIDVARFFLGLSHIDLYHCQDSHYKFFQPSTISGDEDFYMQLQQLPWYYQNWRWEFDLAQKWINKETNVLEVGCGDGKFLQRINKYTNNICGLELNSEAVKIGREHGIRIFHESIEAHASLYTNTYDIICAFQVLEHISDVRGFLNASINLLKKGGKLVICVPNNEGVLKNETENIFNLPPHHIGFWTPKSLKKLEEYYPLKVEKIISEPLSRNDRDWAVHIWTDRMYRYHWRLGKLFKKLPTKFIYNFNSVVGQFVNGHSVLAIYSKSE